MDYVIVYLYVPAINASYDLKIPLSLLILDLVKLLGQGVENLSNGEYQSSGCEILSLKNKEQILYYDQTLQDYGIQNGDMLLMI